MPIDQMERGTFTFRLNVKVKSPKADGKAINIPVDAVIQPKKAKLPQYPLLIEAKSAGDYTNVNKRRKEEATKINQLKAPMASPSFSCCSCVAISTPPTSVTKQPKE